MEQVDFNSLLLMNAQRKSYGVTPQLYDLYSDETDVSLWTWELTSPSLYLESSHLKNVNNLRQSLSQQSQLISSLTKLVKVIGKAKSEACLVKVTTQQQVYLKLVQKKNEAASKLREKLLKEKLKLQEEDDKRRRAENEKRMKELERLNKEQEKIKAKQDRELKVLQEKEQKEQERKNKEDAKERERKEKEEAKEKEKLEKEAAKEKERLEKEAAKEKDRLEKEEKRQQLELEKLERKRKQEEAQKAAAELKEQQKLQKEAELAAKQAQLNRMKLTNFFTDKQKPVAPANPWTKQKAETQAVKQQTVESNDQNAQSNEKPATPMRFSDYQVVTEAHHVQREFAAQVGNVAESRPVYTPELLVQTMKVFQSFYKKIA